VPRRRNHTGKNASFKLNDVGRRAAKPLLSVRSCRSSLLSPGPALVCRKFIQSSAIGISIVAENSHSLSPPAEIRWLRSVEISETSFAGRSFGDRTTRRCDARKRDRRGQNPPIGIAGLGILAGHLRSLPVRQRGIPLPTTLVLSRRFRDSPRYPDNSGFQSVRTGPRNRTAGSTAVRRRPSRRYESVIATRFWS
jgi:hypothetical protein